MQSSLPNLLPKADQTKSKWFSFTQGGSLTAFWVSWVFPLKNIIA